MDGLIKPKFGVMSVYDKTWIVEFAQEMQERWMDILSTGWTFKKLEEWWITVQQISEYSWQEEILGGRVKSLVPEVHGWFLADMSLPEHVEEIRRQGIRKIDLLVGNLYPFEEALQKHIDGKISAAKLIEEIDIGGPAMMRSAAKNFAFTSVLIDPEDYEKFLDELKKNDGRTSLDFREKSAAKAYNYSTYYDGLIGRYLADKTWITPKHTSIPLKNPKKLRYWENPHQNSTLWTVWGETVGGIPGAEQIQWKEMSHNNINDATAAFNIMNEFGNSGPTCCILKHANPCWIAVRDDISEAFAVALSNDSESAFGWIFAVNREIDEKLASTMIETFCEIIMAPAISDEAREVFAKKKNIRVFIVDKFEWHKQGQQQIRSITGGWMLIQDFDTAVTTEADLKIMTSHQPTPEQMKDLLFAFKAVKHIPSNGVVMVQDQTIVAPGAWQPSRVKSVKLSGNTLQTRIEDENDEIIWDNVVMASDAFFPFADSIETAKKLWVKAIITPGGSRNDAEVIAAAEAAWIPLVFAPTRHFKH